MQAVDRDRHARQALRELEAGRDLGKLALAVGAPTAALQVKRRLEHWMAPPDGNHAGRHPGFRNRSVTVPRGRGWERLRDVPHSVDPRSASANIAES